MEKLGLPYRAASGAELAELHQGNLDRGLSDP